MNKQASLKRFCPGRVCSFDAHADGRSDYRHQTAGFHLIFDFRAGLWTGSDLSGERTGSHPVPEQLSVGHGDLASDSLIIVFVGKTFHNAPGSDPLQFSSSEDTHPSTVCSVCSHGRGEKRLQGTGIQG